MSRLSVLLIMPVVLLGGQSTGAADDVRALIEVVNASIDKLPSADDREFERKLVLDIAGPVVKNDISAAQQVAQLNALKSSFPQLREQWRAVHRGLEVDMAAAVAEEEKAIKSALMRLDTAWNASDPETCAVVRTELTSLTTRYHRYRQPQLQAALADVESWQLVLRMMERGLLVEAMDEIDALRHANNSISAEALAGKRTEVLMAMQLRLADFSEQARRQIASCKTTPDRLKALKEIGQRDLSQMAKPAAPGYDRAAATLEFINRWHSALQESDEAQFSSAASGIRSALSLDVNDDLKELARRDLSNIEKRMEEAVATYLEAVEERLGNASTSAEFRVVLEWERLQTQPTAEPASEGYSRMKQIRDCSACLRSIDETLQRHDYAGARDFAETFAEQCRDVIPADDAASLQESIAADIENSLEAHLRDAQERLLASDSTQAASDTVSWLQHGVTVAAGAPEFRRIEDLKFLAAQWHAYHVAVDKLDIIQARVDLGKIETHLDSVNPRDDWFDERLQQARERLETADVDAWADFLLLVQEGIEVAEMEDDLLRLRSILNRRDDRPEIGKIRQDVEQFKRDLEILNDLQRNPKKSDLRYVGQLLRRRQDVSNHHWSEWSNAYEMKLVLPGILATGQVEGLKAQADMTIEELLLHAADDAVAKEDWDRVYQALDVYRTLFSMASPHDAWLNAELAGTKMFVQAQSMEEIGELRTAKRLYESVLGYVAARAPRKQAEAKLKKLRAKHPELFR